jgi:hypothetical protein
LTGVRFPKSLTLIGEAAFYQCRLKEVALPDGCEVAKYAFCKCSVLATVTIGSCCVSIGEWAFEECGALATVTIGSGCISIGEYAFYWCSRLASVTLPSSMQLICHGGFGRCRSLATIAVPKGCELRQDAFYKCSPRVTWF